VRYDCAIELARQYTVLFCTTVVDGPIFARERRTSKANTSECDIADDRFSPC
jgi:hypothetical protein